MSALLLSSITTGFPEERTGNGDKEVARQMGSGRFFPAYGAAWVEGVGTGRGGGDTKEGVGAGSGNAH